MTKEYLLERYKQAGKEFDESNTPAGRGYAVGQQQAYMEIIVREYGYSESIDMYRYIAGDFERIK